VILNLLAACSDYVVNQAPPPPPADPPGEEIDAQGEPPSDWNNCGSGHYGLYFNLPADHPDVEPDTDAPPVNSHEVDWYTTDYLAFSRYDPSIDWGANWWPVDSGLEDDPQYFAVQWTSWLRVWSGGTLEFVVGAEDDVFVEIDGEVKYQRQGAIYDPQTVRIDMPGGQFPVRIRYAHVHGSSDGFRFRLSSGDAKICWPSFPPPDTD
jgi:hypothetical protein